MLSDEQRKSLRGGKYTAWAADLSFEQLEGILWAVGEIRSRGPWMLDVVERAAAAGERPNGGTRAVTALRIILKSVTGVYPSASTVRGMMRTTDFKESSHRDQRD